MSIIIAIPPHTASEGVVSELVACARRLQSLTETPIQMASVGPQAMVDGQKMADETGIDVLTVPIEGPEAATAEVFTDVLADITSEIASAWVVLPHTAAGLDAAPALAVKLSAACITGVEKIETAEGRICFTREIFNGKLTACLTPETKHTVITAQTGAFAAGPQAAPVAGAHTLRPIETGKERSRFKEIFKESADTASLEQADVLVAAGNGVKEPENLELIRQLAALFAKSAVCGSRPVCDKNWLPHSRQVGVTGAIVNPRLYIACGISGASQHLAGIRQAKTIVAINKDPRAAICNAADICVIEDLTTFIPLLIETYKGYGD
ncbi:MAG: electron transfer flavoprotein subunit alpha/FixB family protein [Desulfobacterales bacterium]